MINNISNLLPLHNEYSKEGINVRNLLNFDNIKFTKQDCFVSSGCKLYDTQNIAFSAKIKTNDSIKTVGKAFIKDLKNKKTVPAEIQCEILDKDKIFTVIYKGKTLGKMIINHSNEDNGMYKKTDDYTHVYIDSLKTKFNKYETEYTGLENNFADIGKSLIQVAIEESLKIGGKGRVELSSAQYSSNENPILFYYHLGFRTLNDSINSILSNKLKLRKAGQNIECKIDEQYMYLSPKYIKEYIQKINQNHLLKEDYCPINLLKADENQTK